MPTLLGAVFSIQHLENGYWHDEINTIEKHVTGNVMDPLTQFEDVGNHIFLCVVLSVWQNIVGLPQEVSVVIYRALPWLNFILSILALTYITRSLFGNLTGFLTGFLFSVNHMTLNFSLQLRAYPFSWLPTILALGALFYLLKTSQKKYIWYFLICSAINIGYIFTNLFITFVFLISSLIVCNSSRLKIHLSRRYCIFLFLAPLMGGLFYVGVFQDFIKAISETSTDNYTASGVINFWKHNLSTDVIPMLIGIVLGILFKKFTLTLISKPLYQAHLVLSILFFICFFSFLVFTPKVPGARVFVPCLPVFFFILTPYFSHVIQQIKFRKIAAIIFVFCYLSYSISREKDPLYWIPNYQWMNDPPKHSTVRNFYLDDYYPQKALDEIRELAKEKKIYAFYGGHGIRFLLSQSNFMLEEENLKLYNYSYNFTLKHYNNFYTYSFSGNQYKILIIARGLEHAKHILKSLKFPIKKNWNPKILSKAKNSFKIYEYRFESFAVYPSSNSPE